MLEGLSASRSLVRVIREHLECQVLACLANVRERLFNVSEDAPLVISDHFIGVVALKYVLTS